MTPEEREEMETREAIKERALDIILDTRGPWRDKIRTTLYEIGFWDLLDAAEGMIPELRDGAAPASVLSPRENRLLAAINKVKGRR